MRKGFTLLELIIVMSVIGILATAGITSYQTSLKNTRDAKRKSDINEIRLALENYKSVNGVYPEESSDEQASNWDCSEVGNFIPDLLSQGFLKARPQDPKPFNDDYSTSVICGYRYYKYPADSASNGCGKVLYVLTASMENASNKDLSQIPSCYVQIPAMDAKNLYVVGEFE